jgi:uncharacterized damage-inducible protein DinB
LRGFRASPAVILWIDMENPYAKYLGQRNAYEVLAETTGSLESLLASLGTERAGRAPAPGKWSVREILCHLADCELVFAFRFRQTIAEDHYVIQPFDQEKWATRYAGLDAATALATFSALRRWNLFFLSGVPAEAYGKAVTHPGRGEGTFQILLETVAGHDLNHLGQIEAILAAAA